MVQVFLVCSLRTSISIIDRKFTSIMGSLSSTTGRNLKKPLDRQITPKSIFLFTDVLMPNFSLLKV